MEKHILYFQTAKEAEEANERLCLLDWPSLDDLQVLEPLKGQAAFVLRSTSQLDATTCDRLGAAVMPRTCIWNLDAWADASYRHTFYYSGLIAAETAQEFLPWSFPAWSKVIQVADDLYKICFGTEKAITEQEQRSWCWTYDAEAFEFNELIRRSNQS